MKHYLKKLEETVHEQWTRKALCDYNGDSFTYAQLATNIERFRIFFETAGIKKGDKIAICARNSARWAMTFWGVNANECVAVPLLADFHPDNVSNLTNHSDSVVLFVDDDIWAKMNPDDVPNLKAAINVKDGNMLWNKDKAVADAWENRKSAFKKRYPDGMWPEQVSYPTDNMDDLAIINYTSGTTGNPKGVMLTYGAMSDTDDFANTQFPNQPGETIVSMLPLAHMYGLAIEFIHPNVDGVTVYFLGKTPSPTTLLKAMQDIKPYMVVTVPLVMEKIYANAIKPALEKAKSFLAVPGLNQLIYRKARNKVIEAFGGAVRCFIMGGAALNPEAERCFRKIHLPYTVGYGMTEACPLLGYEWWTRFVPGSCGKPVHELRIDSDDPQHIPGEIQARGRNLTIGYYKNPEATAAAFTEDGWFRTGDLGVMDEKRNIFIRGRIKSMILNSSGQNIYPEEVEFVLNNCQYVEECLVVDRDGKIVALVYPEYPEGMTEEAKAAIPGQIRDEANKSLPAYSKISKVEMMAEPFEKTPKMSIKRFLYR
ncbi:MAG: AMP-binding protein [Muribaculaceae bacterium]|nr:AMP-binding protein [Muribaculaceae bacterium]